MKDIYDILREVRRHGESRLALATLVRAEGSSYRRPGARMLICDDGRTVGSLSGGCLEEEVALRARDVLNRGEPAVMSFDTRRRFGCHGKIDIFIERTAEEFFADLAKHLEARQSCFAITTFEGGPVGEAVSFPLGHLGTRIRPEPDSFPYKIGKNGDGAFIHEIHPPIRLLIIGEGPDNVPFRSLCELLGWIPIEVSDPNTLALEPDEWTAAVVKSHNYGRDFATLRKLLSLNLPYVGLIGPRKRRDQLLNALLDEGITINAGFFAPAGLDLGTESPEEIALSVVSEIQRVFAGGDGNSLRERKMPIHGGWKLLPPNECQISAR